MPAHYATARRMLGVTENRILGDADHMLKKMAEAQGCRRHVLQDRRRGVLRRQARRRRTPIRTSAARARRARRASAAAAAWSAAGSTRRTRSTRTTCTSPRSAAPRCSPRRASPTLRPLDDDRRRRLRARRPSARRRTVAKQRRTIRARHVVLAASALGTMDLLMRMKESRRAAERVAAPRQRRAHELRVDPRRAVPRRAVRHVEGHRDRLGHPHRSVHAHRGHALLARLRRARPDRDDARHRQGLAADLRSGSAARFAIRSGSRAPRGRSGSRARR